MYATKIVVPGPDSQAYIGLFQTTPRGQVWEQMLRGVPVRELWTEQVSQGLVSELPGPNCFRQYSEAENTTTIYNATWVTREAAQQFVDLYVNEFSDTISVSVEEV